MLWALTASLVLNGLLVGFVLGVAYSAKAGDAEYVAVDANGALIPQDDEEEEEAEEKVIGFVMRPDGN